MAKMIKFAICDDEPLMAQEISGLISQYMEEKKLPSYCVELFFDSCSLLESGCDFDVLFLDIQMEKPNGIETARTLRQRGNQSLMIFVTVLKECVFDVFEVEAYDYLLKPIDSRHFRRTMDRAVRTLEQRRSKSILIRRGASCEVILLQEIVYCEVQGRKIFIHKNSGTTIDYYEKLEQLEQRVDSRFFRCHRSYLVNLAYIRGCHAGQVLLPQGEKIPVSRLRERDLSQALLRFMKEKDF